MDKKTSRAKTSGAKLRFTRIELANWRNFRDASIDLKKRAFFIGANASGKSNILAAIRFLRDIAVADGGFQFAVKQHGGMAKIRALHARRTPGTKLSVNIGTDDDPERWRYEIHFKAEQASHKPIIESEKIWKNEELELERPNKEDRSDKERLTQTHLEQVGENKNFREIVEFLRNVLYLHIIPQLIREPDRSVGKQDDPYGGDFLAKLAGATEATRSSRLARINSALQYAVPQFETLQMKQDNGGRWHLEAKYKHWRPQGAFQDETSFSDGTLRLIGLLWSLTEGKGPLLMEEPELSLHVGVINRLSGMMAQMYRTTGRQVLITTHSETLLNDPGIGLDEVHFLLPDIEGTKIETAVNNYDIKHLVKGGVPIGEAVIPYIVPQNIDELKFDV